MVLFRRLVHVAKTHPVASAATAATTAGAVAAGMTLVGAGARTSRRPAYDSHDTGDRQRLSDDHLPPSRSLDR